MADIFQPYRSPSTPSAAPPSFPASSTATSSSSASPTTPAQSYPSMVTIVPSAPASSSHDSSSPHDDSDTPKASDSAAQKMESKPQATFLTKLYALLERPEYQSMIRWDATGEQIIVERPEQLALHVLPSIYRQSRFASFSRQLNIYGFMRKVNLRNVDPAIDDPDASTWSHPTLNRNSPPEVVANFKRRVPPRLPKPRKRPDADLGRPDVMVPSTNMGLPTVPSSIASRSRGFSAPNLTAYNVPSQQPAHCSIPSSGYPNKYGTYPRSTLPPLTVPSDSYPGSYHVPSHSMGGMHPITPTEDTPQSSSFGSSMYQQHPRDPSAVFSYPYTDSSTASSQQNWSFLPPASSLTGPGAPGGGSLSSLLNPPSYNRPGGFPSNGNAQTYPSPFSGVPMPNSHNSSMSPDSRPTTGYSVASSISSMQYDIDTPSSAAHSTHGGFEYRPPSSGSGMRPITPVSNGQRPGSAKSNNPPPASSLSIRRPRTRSEAVGPYPSPYYDTSADSSRPGTASEVSDPHHHALQSNGIGRAEFAYSAPSYGATSTPGDSTTPTPGDSGSWASRGVRPSTSSSMSAGSSHSAIATPPGMEDGVAVHGDADMTRFSPDFGIFPMTVSANNYSSAQGSYTTTTTTAKA